MAGGTKDCFLLISVLAFVVVLVEGGNWNEWRDLTLCNAKPCDCDEKLKCGRNPPKGNKMQIRTCDMSDGKVCKGKFLQNLECRGSNRFCPDWSDWWADGCDCTTGAGIWVRECDQYTSSLKCKTMDGDYDLREEQLFPADERDCRNEPKVECEIEEMSTIPPPTTTTEALPCCNVTANVTTTTDASDYANDINDVDGLGALVRRRKRSDYDIYYDSSAACRDCSFEPTDSEVDDEESTDEEGNDEGENDEEGDDLEEDEFGW